MMFLSLLDLQLSFPPTMIMEIILPIKLAIKELTIATLRNMSLILGKKSLFPVGFLNTNVH